MFGYRLFEEFLLAGVLRIAPVMHPALRLPEPAIELRATQRLNLREPEAPAFVPPRATPDVDEQVGNWLAAWVVPAWHGHAAIYFGKNLAHDPSGVHIFGFKLSF